MSGVNQFPKKRVRVGVDFHTWDGIFQGTRSHILGLYREAITCAPDLDFVFFLEGIASLKAAHPEFSAPNVQLVSMPNHGGLWRLMAQLPNLQRRHAVDILHLQYRLPLFRSSDCAVTLHDLLFETHPQYFKTSYVWDAKVTFRNSARRAQELFTVSEFSKLEIVRRYGVNSDRIHVTRNGVDTRCFFPATGPDSRLEKLGVTHRGYMLTVGRLEPRKNHATLIKAYAQLQGCVPPLVIAGQPDFGYASIFSLIRKARLQNRIRVLPDVPDEVLPILMRHARLFIFPSFAEGFGLPVVEAMASGIPVIASDTTALPEIGGSATLYVSPQNWNQLSQLMQRVLGDETLSGKLARDGIEQAKKFSWAQPSQTLLGAFRRRFARRNSGQICQPTRASSSE